MLSYEEYSRLSTNELMEEIARAKRDLFTLRLELASKQLKNTAELKALRKYTAKLKTRLSYLKHESLKENPKSSIIT